MHIISNPIERFIKNKATVFKIFHRKVTMIKMLETCFVNAILNKRCYASSKNLQKGPWKIFYIWTKSRFGPFTSINVCVFYSKMYFIRLTALHSLAEN